MIFSNESCWGRWWDKFQDHGVTLSIIRAQEWSPCAEGWKLKEELDALVESGAIVLADGERLRVFRHSGGRYALERIDGTRPHRFPFSDPRKRRGGVSSFVRSAMRLF